MSTFFKVQMGQNRGITGISAVDPTAWVVKRLIPVKTIGFYIVSLVGKVIFNDYNKIVNSIEKDPVIAENEESIESQAENSDIQEQSIPEEPTVADESSWTREQQNAYKAAKSYLNFLPFSKQGLIEQLSSEYGDQYPEEVAVFAVEQLEERGEVDWYEQAEKCAKSYLEVMDFSRQELIDQLCAR